MQKICSIEYLGERVHLLRTAYSNGRVALVMESEDHEPYGTLSVNLPTVPLTDDQIAIKNWSENEEVAHLFFATGVFEDTGLRLPAGFASAPVWRLATPTT